MTRGCSRAGGIPGVGGSGCVCVCAWGWGGMEWGVGVVNHEARCACQLGASRPVPPTLGPEGGQALQRTRTHEGAPPTCGGR